MYHHHLGGGRSAVRERDERKRRKRNRLFAAIAAGTALILPVAPALASLTSANAAVEHYDEHYADSADLAGGGLLRTLN
jgi:hypothetical protein